MPTANPGTTTDVALALLTVALKPVGFDVAVKLVIAEPPSDAGATHDTVTALEASDVF